MASSSSTSHRNTENKSSSPITPPNPYNISSTFPSSLDPGFKRLTSMSCDVSGTNSHPVHHDEPPATTIIDINSHDLSSSSVPLTINSNNTQENNQFIVNSNPTNYSQENNQTVLLSSSVPLSVNSNPTNDSQENNQSVLLPTQSLRRIELGPAFSDNAVVGLRIYANNTQLVLHVTNIQMTAPNTGKSLGKTFLGLTYQAAIGFSIFHYQSLSSSSSSSVIGAPSVPLHIVGVATVVGFAASLIGVLLHKPYPVVAAIVEKFGSFSAAFGFFVMMGVFLPRISQWIEWVAGIGCFIAFGFAFLKVR